MTWSAILHQNPLIVPDRSLTVSGGARYKGSGEKISLSALGHGRITDIEYIELSRTGCAGDILGGRLFNFEGSTVLKVKSNRVTR